MGYEERCVPSPKVVGHGSTVPVKFTGRKMKARQKLSKTMIHPKTPTVFNMWYVMTELINKLFINNVPSVTRPTTKFRSVFRVSKNS